VSQSRHLRRVFSLLLACLWIANASFAQHLSAEFPLCQPERFPCCPLPINNARQSCPACQVSLVIAKKEELKSEAARFASLPKGPHNFPPQPLIDEPLQELTQGLRYHPVVFQLKDDLRI
jgi:hypothetical protein